MKIPRGLTIVAAAVCVAALALLARAEPAAAQNLICMGDSPCLPPEDFVWMIVTESVRIVPGSGGFLANEEAGFELTVPPSAAPVPITLTYSSTASSPYGLSWTVRGLGYFSLQARDNRDRPLAALKTAWSLRFRYGACPPSAPCIMDFVDEASLRCAVYNPETRAWQNVPSRTDVFANHLTCTSDALGHFALIADPLITSGLTNQVVVFLPLLARSAP